MPHRVTPGMDSPSWYRCRNLRARFSSSPRRKSRNSKPCYPAKRYAAAISSSRKATGGVICSSFWRCPEGFPAGSRAQLVVQSGLDQSRNLAELHCRYLERHSGFPDLHVWLADLFVQMGKTDEAVKALNEALRLKPKYPEARAKLSRLTGRPAESQRHQGKQARQGAGSTETTR
ncbi:MAG TPA: tetratricopeptide repeat protein [Candidatus Ozemobacteraceae bacterium]